MRVLVPLKLPSKYLLILSDEIRLLPVTLNPLGIVTINCGLVTVVVPFVDSRTFKVGNSSVGVSAV